MQVLSIEAECELPVPVGALEGLEGVSAVAIEGSSVRCRLRGDMDPVLRALLPYHVRRLVSREPSLNDIFLHMYGESGEPLPAAAQ
jgi:ABC-2 type transport system ATP-binding protein